MSDTAVATSDLGELFAALAKAQGQMKAAMKDSANPFFKSKYADLSSVWGACRDALSANGIAIVQFPVNDGEMVGLRTILGHSSGQCLESVVWTKPTKNDPQSLGSAVTYLRRYAVAAAVGVVTEDDDGEGAQGRGADPKAQGAAIKAPAAPRANTVKHSGDKASPEAIKMLHTLRAKVGGLVVCDAKAPCPYPNKKRCGYHTQLAAFKDSEGNPVLSSKDLSPEQIANLIGRYEKKITEQGMRAQQEPDLGAALGDRDPGCDDEPPMADAGDLADLEDAARKRWGEGFAQKFNQWLAGAFDYDSVLQLHKQEAIDAVRMLGEGK